MFTILIFHTNISQHKTQATAEGEWDIFLMPLIWWPLFLTPANIYHSLMLSLRQFSVCIIFSPLWRDETFLYIAKIRVRTGETHTSLPRLTQIHIDMHWKMGGASFTLMKMPAVKFMMAGVTKPHHSAAMRQVVKEMLTVRLGSRRGMTGGWGEDEGKERPLW